MICKWASWWWKGLGRRRGKEGVWPCVGRGMHVRWGSCTADLPGRAVEATLQETQGFPKAKGRPPRPPLSPASCAIWVFGNSDAVSTAARFAAARTKRHPEPDRKSGRASRHRRVSDPRVLSPAQATDTTRGWCSCVE